MVFKEGASPFRPDADSGVADSCIQIHEFRSGRGAMNLQARLGGREDRDNVDAPVRD